MAFDLATAKPVASKFDLATAQPVNSDAAPNDDGYAMRTLKNVPNSAGAFIGSMVDAVRHPVRTVETVRKLGEGAVQNALPASMQAESASDDRALASAVGQFYKQRYGSVQAFKDAVEKDPVGILADVSTFVTGGGSVAAKVPGLAKVGAAVKAAGEAVAPLNVVGAAVKPALNAAGKTAANAIGSLGTHTGAQSITEAFKAGERGGAKADAFQANLRGDVPMEKVLDQARAAVANLRQERGDAYRQGMAGVSSDKTILDMQPVVDSLNQQFSKGVYKGQVINPSVVQTQNQIRDAVVNWWQLEPKEFHTPEGLDALKKQIGDIRDTTEFGTPSRTVADGVYHSIRNEITKQAPTYAKVMKDYESMSDQIKQVERGLSLGPKERVSTDTAMRKLQSLMRNNVNTNYGNRMEMAKALEGAGASTLMPSLAGQALNTWTPRGLGNLTMLPLSGAAGYLAGGIPAAVAGLGAQSPRLMGEAAYYAGKLKGGLSRSHDAVSDKIGDPALLAQLLVQTNRQRPREDSSEDRTRRLLYALQSAGP